MKNEIAKKILKDTFEDWIEQDKLMSEPDVPAHEYKCEKCQHKDNCIRVHAFLMANVYPYSDGCECFEMAEDKNETN